MSRLKLHDDGGGSNSGDKKRGGKTGRGRGTGRGGGSASSGRARSPPGPCPRCSKTGHWARDCPTKPKKEQAHIAHGEEDEPTLLMAHAFVSSVQTSSTAPHASSRAAAVASLDSPSRRHTSSRAAAVASPDPPSRRQVHLVESVTGRWWRSRGAGPSSSPARTASTAR
jgi:hypothetical protein